MPAKKDTVHVQAKFRITLSSVVESLCHGVVLAITISVAWFSFVNFNLFSFHPPLFSAGYFIFMTEGFLIFLPESILTRGWKHHELVKLHWLLQTVAFCCIGLGFIAVVTIKIQVGNPHFAYPHSITGLVAVILAVLTGCGGTVVRMGPYKNGPSLAQLKLGHVGIGLLAYGVGISTLVLGYFTTYFAKLVQFEWRVFMAVITVMVAALAFGNALLGFYRRVKNFVAK